RNHIHSGKRRHASADGITFSGKDTEGAPNDRHDPMRCPDAAVQFRPLTQERPQKLTALEQRYRIRVGVDDQMITLVAPQHAALKRTPLYDLHVAKGARMGPFAGYEMPIQYPPGIMEEHLHTRACRSV